MNTFKRILAVVVLAASGTTAAAQDYPSRDITLIVPHNPGSITDTLTRTIADPLAEALGVSVVIDNRPGANTTMGTEVLSRADPDGYTIMMATAAGVAASPAGLVEGLRYDPIEDLDPVILVGSVNYLLLTNPDFPANSLEELVAQAKDAPGDITYGSGNNGGIIYMAMLQRVAGIEMNHIPYSSTPQAVTDMLGGHIDMMFTDSVSSLPLITDGKVKALAITTAERSKIVPQVPTLLEQGIEGIPDLSGWLGLYVPAGTPREIVDRLNAEVSTILQSDALVALSERTGIELLGSTPEELDAYNKDQIDSYRVLIEEFDLANK